MTEDIGFGMVVGFMLAFCIAGICIFLAVLYWKAQEKIELWVRGLARMEAARIIDNNLEWRRSILEARKRKK